MKNPRPLGMPRKKRFRDLSFNRMIPNILTLLALAAGLTAIRFGLEGRWEHAVLAIFVAAVLDALDGRIARLLKGASKFGAELDSLSDFVCFGVSPVLVLYLWTMKDAGRLGWVLVMLFSICCGLRLARFNIQTKQTKKLDKRYFVGLPIPAAAGIIASCVLFLGESPSLEILEYQVLSPEVTSALMVVLVAVIAFLMVSKVRYRSLKEFDISRRHPFTILFSLLLAMLIVASKPSLLLFGFFFLYALSGFLRYLPFVRRRVSLDLGEELELTPGEPRSL